VQENRREDEGLEIKNQSLAREEETYVVEAQNS